MVCCYAFTLPEPVARRALRPLRSPAALSDDDASIGVSVPLLLRPRTRTDQFLRLPGDVTGGGPATRASTASGPPGTSMGIRPAGREAFQAEWEHERPREMEPAPTHEPDPQWLQWIEALEAEQIPMQEAESRESAQPEQQEEAEPKRDYSQDWGLKM